MKISHANSLDKFQLEEGTVLAPNFDDKGLVTVVTIHAETKDVLMVAYMNKESLVMTLEKGEAVYWSRSRQEIWHKGATSGQTQKVTEIRTDCDQDAIVMSVLPGGNGGCCHVGYHSCFYRKIDLEQTIEKDEAILSAPDQNKLS